MDIVKKKIGTTIIFKISPVDSSVILTDRDFKIFILHAKFPKNKTLLNHSIEDNKIIATFQGKSQKYLGKYTLFIYENYKKDSQTVVDITPLELVESTDDETEDSDVVTTETIDLSVDIVYFADYNQLINKPSINNSTIEGELGTSTVTKYNATLTTNGLMSADDKSKLDGTSATTNLVLTKLSDGTTGWLTVRSVTSTLDTGSDIRVLKIENGALRSYVEDNADYAAVISGELIKSSYYSSEAGESTTREVALSSDKIVLDYSDSYSDAYRKLSFNYNNISYYDKSNEIDVNTTWKNIIDIANNKSKLDKIDSNLTSIINLSAYASQGKVLPSLNGTFIYNSYPISHRRTDTQLASVLGLDIEPNRTIDIVVFCCDYHESTETAYERRYLVYLVNDENDGSGGYYSAREWIATYNGNEAPEWILKLFSEWEEIDATFAKKDVATTSDNGLMSAEDKTKIDLLIKGNIISNDLDNATEGIYRVKSNSGRFCGHLYAHWYNGYFFHQHYIGVGTPGTDEPTGTICEEWVRTKDYTTGSYTWSDWRKREATTTESGFMSSSDKTKLDGITFDDNGNLQVTINGVTKAFAPIS